MPPLKIGGGDVAPMTQDCSFRAFRVSDPSSNKPITGFISEDASNLAELHPDWQDLVRRRALRSIISIPIRKQSGLVGCLTMGCLDPVDWEEQWWYGGLQLLSGWAVTVLSTYRTISHLDFFKQLYEAENLSALAAAFVHTFPDSLHSQDLGCKVELRLALVSSNMTRALVYSQDPRANYNSIQDRQRIMTSDSNSTLLAKMAKMDWPQPVGSSLPKAGHVPLPSSDSSTFLNSMEHLVLCKNTESRDDNVSKDGLPVKEDSVLEAVIRLRQSISPSPFETLGIIPLNATVLEEEADSSGSTSTNSSGSKSTDIPQVGKEHREVEKPGGGLSGNMHQSLGFGSQRRASALIASTISKIKHRVTATSMAGAAAAGLLQIGDSSDTLDHHRSSSAGRDPLADIEMYSILAIPMY